MLFLHCECKIFYALPSNKALTVNLEEILYRQFGSEHRKDSVIFKEGDPGNLVYIIQSGRVQITKALGERTKVLSVLSRGEFFGEMALISDRPRSATATALEDCRLLGINSEMFFKILRSSYDITLRIIEQLAARLAEADKRLEVILFTDATTRLVRQFESLAEESQATNAVQLAYELGVPQERIQRILVKLEEKGIVSMKTGSVTVVDKTKLTKLKNYLLLKEEFGQIE